MAITIIAISPALTCMFVHFFSDYFPRYELVFCRTCDHFQWQIGCCGLQWLVRCIESLHSVEFHRSMQRHPNIVAFQRPAIDANWYTNTAPRTQCMWYFASIWTIRMVLAELAHSRCTHKSAPRHSIRPFPCILMSIHRAIYDQHHNDTQSLSECCNHSQRRTNRAADSAPRT